MTCVQCGETVRTQSIICQVCGETQPVPAAGSGLALPLDRSDWAALAPVPDSSLTARDVAEGAFGIGDIFCGVVEIIGAILN